MKPNNYRIDGDVVYLTLTQGQETKINKDDLAQALLFRWRASWNGDIQGYYVTTAVARAAGGMTTLYLHRYLMGEPKGLTIDHENHDTLDNLRSNLRVLSNRQNNENRNGAHKNNKLGIRGLSTHKDQYGVLRYMARVAPGGRQIAKYFPHTPEGLEDAKAALIEMRREHMTHSGD